MLNQRIMRKEFALSGSEQNPDLGRSSFLQVAALPARTHGRRLRWKAFKEKGEDFVVRPTLADLVRRMNELSAEAISSISRPWSRR